MHNYRKYAFNREQMCIIDKQVHSIYNAFDTRKLLLAGEDQQIRFP